MAGLPDTSLTDPRCLVTTETLIIDGANAVCRFPRIGAHREALPGIAWQVAIALALLLIVAVRRQRVRRRLVTAVLIGALGSAIPGTYALLALRADGPLRQAQTGREITDLLVTVDEFVARKDECVVLDSQCFACRAILLFVSRARIWDEGAVGSGARVPFPGIRVCRGPSGLITLGADSLERSCRASDDSLVCGSPGDSMPSQSVPDRSQR